MKESDQIVQYVQKKKKLEKQKLKKQQKMEKALKKLENVKATIRSDGTVFLKLGVFNLLLSPLVFFGNMAICKIMHFGRRITEEQQAKEYLLNNPDELGKAEEILNTNNVDYIAYYMTSNAKDAAIISDITGYADYVHSMEMGFMPEALLLTAVALIVPFAAEYLAQGYMAAKVEHLSEKAVKIDSEISDINKQIEQCEEEIFEQNNLVLKKN